MPERAQRTLSQRPLTERDYLTGLNREVLPLIAELRSVVNGTVGPVSPVFTTDQIVSSEYQYWLAQTSASPVDMTLPPALGWTLPLTFKRINSVGSALTIYPDGTDTIDGLASVTASGTHRVAILVSDGESTWWRLG